MREDDVTSFDLATVASSSAVAVESSWTVHRFTRRHSLDAESRTKNLAATADLAQLLRDLQGLGHPLAGPHTDAVKVRFGERHQRRPK